MAKHNCENCGFRTRYDSNPKSFLGWLWRWHANWCPGWRAYMTSLSDDERRLMADRYGLKKYR